MLNSVPVFCRVESTDEVRFGKGEGKLSVKLLAGDPDLMKETYVVGCEHEGSSIKRAITGVVPSRRVDGDGAQVSLLK